MNNAADSQSTPEVTDIVCGMAITPGPESERSQYESETYFFCKPDCKAKFDADPYFYASGNAKRKTKTAVKDTIYTCPMHPEIERSEPGICPICGMDLEPVGAVDDHADHHLTDFTRRFWVSAILAIPVVILAMAPLVGIPLRHSLGERLSIYLELILTTPVVLWAALPFFQRGWESIKNRSPNMWTLIALGVGMAYAYSLVATFFPGLFPEAYRKDGYVGTYYEAAVVIIALVFLGQVLELRARGRTGEAINALLALSPKTIRRVLPSGEEYDAPIENLLEGDWLRIRPGENVPVDGGVIDGQSLIDESLLSGEPIPVEKFQSDKVTSGTTNKSGSLVIKAQAVGEDTLLAQIVEAVSQAQRSRAPLQAWADRVAAYFVPAVVLIAITSFVIWMLVGPDPRLAYALTAAVSVLIIACPCAMGLATPMSITTAVGKGAKAGLLVKDAESLERMAKAEVLIVDKTGTLTQGQPKLSDIILTGKAGMDEQSFLSRLASLEQGSEHPLAEAIVGEAKSRGLTLKTPDNFEAVMGHGVEGVVEGENLTFGNKRLMDKLSVSLSELESQTQALRSDGKTVMFAASENKLLGLVAVSDPLKAESPDAVKALQERGLQIVMATGDNLGSAKAVAGKLGIEDVFAEMLPQDKQELVEKFQGEGKAVVMAGDGINDAPALASASVGIAMGTGADVAKQSAGITLLKGDIRGILRAHRLAKATVTNLYQNLVLAFGYNTLAIPLAAGVLFPFWGWLLSPIIAAAAMSLSSVSVISNSLRLNAVKL